MIKSALGCLCKLYSIFTFIGEPRGFRTRTPKRFSGQWLFVFSFAKLHIPFVLRFFEFQSALPSHAQYVHSSTSSGCSILVVVPVFDRNG